MTPVTDLEHQRTRWRRTHMARQPVILAPPAALTDRSVDTGTLSRSISKVPRRT